MGADVSGVAEYRASFELGQAARSGERLLLDLGSTSGGLGSVVVNGGEPRGFDTSHPVVDITDAVRTGSNDVVVRTASSLNNRLIARGYYDDLLDVGAQILGHETVQTTIVRPHGLVGPVRLLSAS